MNKVYGNKKEFTPIRSDRSRLIVSYNLQPLEDGIHATWCEIYFYKKPHPYVSAEEIKLAILEDIDNEVKRVIIEDFVWNSHKVWLSIENQNNYSNALDVAINTEGANLPYKVRFGTIEEPDYYTFTTVESLKAFWLACSKYITDSIKSGWALKDSINWKDYEV